MWNASFSFAPLVIPKNVLHTFATVEYHTVVVMWCGYIPSPLITTVQLLYSVLGKSVGDVIPQAVIGCDDDIIYYFPQCTTNVLGSQA